MNQKFLKIIDFLLFSLLPAALCYYLHILLFKVTYKPVMVRMMLIMCVLVYLPYLFYRFHIHENLIASIKEHLLTIFFVIYILHISYFTFIAHNDYIHALLPNNKDYLHALIIHWNTTSNIVPFLTFAKLTKILENPYISNYYAVLSISIRFIFFMPFAYFLPKLHKQMKKPFVFIIFMFLLCLVVEFIQFFLLSGIFNIDDIILHFTGALFALFIFYNFSYLYD